MVFNRSENTGNLHSFSEIYVDPDEEFSFNIELCEKTAKLHNAIVLPESHGVGAEQCEDGIDGVTFENIEIFRDEGRPILVKIYDEEKENFSIKNVEFKNITYTSYMPAKIEENFSDTNTVEVNIENIKANGHMLTKPSALITVGENCDVTFN